MKIFRRIIKAAILAVFLVGNLLNIRVGWADNGDYTRLMSMFTSGPVSMEQNWPDSNAMEQLNQRFFNYWIPEWKLDFPFQRRTLVSAMLLWVPGMLINQVVYSGSVLYMPVMSIVPRLVLLLFLWLVFQWIDRRSARPFLSTIAIGLPLALLFSTTDVIAFFNSFYQETGAIVFIPFLLAAVVLGRIRPRTWKYYLLLFASLLLVTTSKSSCVYWPIIILPFVIPWNQVRKQWTIYLPAAAVLVLVPLFLGLKLTNVWTPLPFRQYNSLFTGTLMLSSDPTGQVQSLGMPQAVRCIGVDAYSDQGSVCLDEFAGYVGYRATLMTMLREPAIVLRQVERLTQTSQNYSLPLGKYALGEGPGTASDLANLWSEIKRQVFPRGWALMVFLLVAAGLIYLSWRRQDWVGDLARVALICLLAFWIDMFVQIWGDGQRDLLKHLFIANMLFDFGFIAAVDMGLSLLVEKVETWQARRILAKASAVQEI